MTFRRQTYPEVLENLLTSLTGGVAAESHPFPPSDTEGPPFGHILQRAPIDSIVSIHGSRDGQPHLFRQGQDYVFDQDKTVRWQTGAELPDPGTLVQINYYPQGAQPSLTDIQTGSVVRTLSESIALEMARLYAQLQVVYDSGYIDTASGRALDHVVAVLGIERVRGGRASGEIELTRSPGTRGVINIPAGTRVITPDGSIEYETTAAVTLVDGQRVVRVVARDLEPNEPLTADALTVLPVPIVGIAGVTNPAPTSIATLDETDDELRVRAKNFLHGSERATLGAIKEAIARQGITADVNEVDETPGVIEITPHAASLSPEARQRLDTAIDKVRPAGVKVMSQPTVAPSRVDLELRITTRDGLLEQDLRAAQREIRRNIEDYFARLPLKEAASINQIVGLTLSVEQVSDVRLLSAIVDGEPKLDRDAGVINIQDLSTVLGDLQIADPNLPTLLNVVVTYPAAAAPADQPAIEAALNDTLTYLNDLNAAERPPLLDAVGQPRLSPWQLSFEKLLRVIPLPDKAGQKLSEIDAAIEDGTSLDPLPATSPYRVQFSFTLESGVTRLLAQLSDPVYELTPFERLSLAGVVVQEAADE